MREEKLREEKLREEKLREEKLREEKLREAHIEKTIEISKQAFYKGLETGERTWQEFLAGQLRFVRKRWWVFQFLILAFLWAVMYFRDSQPEFQREAAVLMPVFGILIVPELWKNVHNHSTEVENAACFTMRQIYAARLVMFALMDLLLLTVFFTVTTLTVHLTLLAVIVQFLIPLNVTACICFGTLCVRRFQSEYAAVGFCILWAGVWYRMIRNERFYHAISETVWFGLMFLTFAGALLLAKLLLKTSTSQGYSQGDVLWN